MMVRTSTALLVGVLVCASIAGSEGAGAASRFMKWGYDMFGRSPIPRDEHGPLPVTASEVLEPLAIEDDADWGQWHKVDFQGGTEKALEVEGTGAMMIGAGTSTLGFKILVRSSEERVPFIDVPVLSDGGDSPGVSPQHTYELKKLPFGKRTIVVSYMSIVNHPKGTEVPAPDVRIMARPHAMSSSINQSVPAMPVDAINRATTEASYGEESFCKPKNAVRIEDGETSITVDSVIIDCGADIILSNDIREVFIDVEEDLFMTFTVMNSGFAVTIRLDDGPDEIKLVPTAEAPFPPFSKKVKVLASGHNVFITRSPLYKFMGTPPPTTLRIEYVPVATVEVVDAEERKTEASKEVNFLRTDGTWMDVILDDKYTANIFAEFTETSNVEVEVATPNFGANVQISKVEGEGVDKVAGGSQFFVVPFDSKSGALCSQHCAVAPLGKCRVEIKMQQYINFAERQEVSVRIRTVKHGA